MSSTDFLFSLRKLLAWLFAFLSALLPQHLMAQLSALEVPPAIHAPSPQYAQSAKLPQKLDRAALPQSDAKADASATASETAAAHAP